MLAEQLQNIVKTASDSRHKHYKTHEDRMTVFSSKNTTEKVVVSICTKFWCHSNLRTKCYGTSNENLENIPETKTKIA